MALLLNYKGLWNPRTNSPILIDAIGTLNDFYIIDGKSNTPYFNRDLGSGNTTWITTQYVIYDGTKWISSLNSSLSTGGVTSLTISAPLTGGTITSTGTIGITKATSLVDGYLSATDFTTFSGKQNAITTGTTAQYLRGDLSLATFPSIPSVGTWGALNYPTWASGTPFVKMTAAGTFGLDTNTYLTDNQTITLSSEATGSGTTGITVTLSNAAIIGKVLTGYISGAGTVTATDTILQAIQKLNGNIGGLTTGVSSVFGRTGAVTAASNDYTFAQLASIPTTVSGYGITDVYTKTAGDARYAPIAIVGTVTSVTGTANRIAVATGTTTPVIDIASTYLGQTSITTLGTITTGTLSTGTVIAGVTMTLGSDANYDTYYRNSSGVLTRLANGTTGQVLTATTSSAPTWTAAGTGTVTSVATGAGLTGGTITTSGTVSIDTTYSNTWTALQEILLNPGANTIVDAIRLYNTTTSSLGNQMYPGAIHFQGQGWKNNITAASQTVDWRMYMVPVGGATAANMNFIMDAQSNGGGYIQQFIINQSTGLLTVSGLTSNNGVTATTGFSLTGGKISITTGSNKSIGIATLSSGTVTVSNTIVTANSLVFVQYQSGVAPSGATLTRILRCSTQTAGTSFVIVAEIAPLATNTSDNSSVQWWFVN